MHTDHLTLRYLMSKKDAKLQIIRQVLLLKEFYFVVKDRKGTENQVADHLYILEDKALLELREEGEINYMFSDEKVFTTTHDLIHSYAAFANYLASDETYFNQSCADGNIRCCVPW